MLTFRGSGDSCRILILCIFLKLFQPSLNTAKVSFYEGQKIT